MSCCSDLMFKKLEIFRSAGVEISEKMVEQFTQYEELLIEWNKNINLTAIDEPVAIWEKHFLDSILPIIMCDVQKSADVVDVGTGAGFPSVPMWIYRNDLNFTLVDSLRKRLKFLAELSEKLGMKAEIVHSRAEDFGRSEYREKFDVAVARAVASMPILCEYCLPLLKVGGIFVALKGRDCRDELDFAAAHIKRLGGTVENVREYTLPCGDKRTLIVVRKNAKTPKTYPRNTASINKEFK